MILVDIIHLLDANQPDFKHAIYVSSSQLPKSEG